MNRSCSQWNISAEDIKMALHAVSSEEDLLSNSSHVINAVDAAFDDNFAGAILNSTSTIANAVPPSVTLLKRNVDREHEGGVKIRRMSSSFSSYINLSALSLSVFDDVDNNSNTPMADIVPTTDTATIATNDRQHIFHQPSIGRTSSYSSLAFQLQYVAPSNDAFGTCVATAPYLIFPNLHATVSAASSLVSSTTTHQNPDIMLLSSESSNNTFSESKLDSDEERYGWFVEMEIEASPPSGLLLNSVPEDHVVVSELATCIPQCGEEEAELLWAQAAETIDNVL